MEELLLQDLQKSGLCLHRYHTLGLSNSSVLRQLINDEGDVNRMTEMENVLGLGDLASCYDAQRELPPAPQTASTL